MNEGNLHEPRHRGKSPPIGGFPNTNCLLINKARCHWTLPAWSLPANSQADDIDRIVLENLRLRHSVAWTGKATAYCLFDEAERDFVEGMTPAPSAQPAPSQIRGGASVRGIPATPGKPGGDELSNLLRLDINTHLPQARNDESRPFPCST